MSQKKKILTGGIYHESHSFSNVPTDLAAFRSVLLIEGQAAIDEMRGTVSEMAGFINAAEKFDLELIPSLWAWGVSTGPVTSETLEYLIGVVEKAYRAADQVDGILFALHGAMVAERSLDGDGYIISRIREFAGSTPISITLDLHANISELMVEKADVIVGYDTYPHIDQVERGEEAGELLVNIIDGKISPVMSLKKPPMLSVPNTQLTDSGPMKELIATAHQAECDEKVLSVTIAAGFPYSDVPEAGPGILVITDNEPEKANDLSEQIAARCWDLREDFSPSMPSITEAVQMAIDSAEHPVILADIGDNIGAGTHGDSTFILHELIARQADDAVVIIADPESVAAAYTAGLGNYAELNIGGKCDNLHGEPVSGRFLVKNLTDGIFKNIGPMRDGIIEKMGRTAVVETGSIKIVLTEIKMPPWNLEQLRSVGIEPKDQKIIALKSAVAFRAAYQPIAGKMIEVNTPGLSTIDLTSFDYKHIRNGLYPLSK